MAYLNCIVAGYLLGSISPSAIISKVKNINLKESGTKNLGATNTMLVFGKAYGFLVMLVDVFKSTLAVLVAKFMAPEIAAAGIIGGAAAVVGHIFPFYLKFRGGKGLASFAGLLLALDPMIFFITLLLAVSMILIFNYCVAAPFTGAIVFPILFSLKTDDKLSIIVAIGVSLLLALRHIPDVFRIKRGEDFKIRELIKKHIHK